MAPSSSRLSATQQFNQTIAKYSVERHNPAAEEDRGTRRGSLDAAHASALDRGEGDGAIINLITGVIK